MVKKELFLFSFPIFLSIILLFIINLSLPVLIITLLLIFNTSILLYLYIRKKKIRNSLVKQVKKIKQGDLNSRILLKSQDEYSELAVIFNELNEKLQAETIKNNIAKESRKRLLANISHDIRTPLTSILGYVEVLKDEENFKKSEKDKYLNILVNKAENLKYLINEIFQMARLDAEEFELNCEVHDLAEIVRESLIDFLPIIKKEELETKIDLPEQDCLIYADRFSVRRIIDNILKNSIKHGKNGGVIGIELFKSSDGFILNVWDKGSGIKKEDIPYIFDRLYRGDKSKTQSLSGSGLGLAIAKKLLEKHGGKISLDSKMDEKTIFKLFFPGI